MRKLFLSATLLFQLCLSWSHGQELPRVEVANHQSDLERENIKGKVEKIESLVAHFNCNNEDCLQGEFKLHQSETYDVDGNLQETNKDGCTTKTVNRRKEIICLDSHEKFKSKTIVLMNDAGKETERIQTDEDGSEILRTKYVYDQNGRITEEITSDSKARTERILYIYDSKGKLVEEIYQKGDGSQDHKRVFKYDSEERIILSASYYPRESQKANLTNKKLYKYDSKGNMTEMVSIDSHGKVVAKLEWKYHYKGNTTEKQTLFNGTLQSKEVIESDPQGNWTRRILYGCDLENDSSKCLPSTETVRKIDYY